MVGWRMTIRVKFCLQAVSPPLPFIKALFSHAFYVSVIASFQYWQFLIKYTGQRTTPVI